MKTVSEVASQFNKLLYQSLNALPTFLSDTLIMV